MTSSGQCTSGFVLVLPCDREAKDAHRARSSQCASRFVQRRSSRGDIVDQQHAQPVDVASDKRAPDVLLSLLRIQRCLRIRLSWTFEQIEPQWETVCLGQSLRNSLALVESTSRRRAVPAK
jgi:hypothetical protein